MTKNRISGGKKKVAPESHLVLRNRAHGCKEAAVFRWEYKLCPGPLFRRERQEISLWGLRTGREGHSGIVLTLVFLKEGLNYLINSEKQLSPPQVNEIHFCEKWESGVRTTTTRNLHFFTGYLLWWLFVKVEDSFYRFVIVFYGLIDLHEGSRGTFPQL